MVAPRKRHHPVCLKRPPRLEAARVHSVPFKDALVGEFHVTLVRGGKLIDPIAVGLDDVLVGCQPICQRYRATLPLLNARRHPRALQSYSRKLAGHVGQRRRRRERRGRRLRPGHQLEQLRLALVALGQQQRAQLVADLNAERLDQLERGGRALGRHGGGDHRGRRDRRLDGGVLGAEGHDQRRARRVEHEHLELRRR